MSPSPLPIPDYDHLTLGDLVTRIRSLDAVGIEVLLEHEAHHAARPAAREMLQHRREELNQGAQPSDGDPSAPAPDLGPANPSPDQASPQTEGPPQNPPSHGDPSNPAQPR
jgi:hypothetical protein